MVKDAHTRTMCLCRRGIRRQPGTWKLHGRSEKIRVLLVLLAAPIALTACGAASRTANGTSTSTLPSSTTTTRPSAETTVPGSAGTTSTSLVPNASWPLPVREAMAYVAPLTSMSLEAPRSLPNAGTAPPNSATGRAGDYYFVSLYSCPSPQPFNNPGVGTGACGSMANIYGSFSGHAYSSTAAALASLPSASPPGGCPVTSRVTLQAGVVATLYSGPQGGNCEVVWHEGEWSFTLEGALTSDSNGNSGGSWSTIAHQIVTYLDQYLLPETHGSFTCDIAPDGLHSTANWVVGDDVYGASTYHGAVSTLALTIAMAAYPR